MFKSLFRLPSRRKQKVPPKGVRNRGRHYLRTERPHSIHNRILHEVVLLNANTPGTEEAKQRCWTSVPTKVSGEINETLTRQLTLSEILTAIKALPKGKAPGNDGMPMEFFHECAEETAPILLQAFTSMVGTGRASAAINKGVITLIPKSGDRAKLSNWRPITLLGSTYKVLAKVLAGRIKVALTHII
jgi:hypothetical protein